LSDKFWFDGNEFGNMEQ